MITPEDFKDKYPEFDCEKSPKIQRFIDIQLCQMNACVWGEKLDIGLELSVAHRLMVFNTRASGGLVTSDKVGDLARNYSIDSKDPEAFWKQTQYGIDYLNVMKTLQVTPRVL